MKASSFFRKSRPVLSFLPNLEHLETRLVPATQTVSFTSVNVSALAGGTGQSNAITFNLTRSGAAADLANPLTLGYVPMNGTATLGVDYTDPGAPNDQVTFAANSKTASITFDTIGNNIYQPNKSFTVELINEISVGSPTNFPTYTTVNSSGTPTNGLTPRELDVTTPNGAAIDFLGNGKSDLVTANESSDDLSVLINTTTTAGGTPSYTTYNFNTVNSSGTTLTDNENRWSAVVADLNGDGKPDIITANPANDSINYLINTTAAGATTPTFTPYCVNLASGDDPYFVAVADVNGDGLPDIIVGNHGNSDVVALLNSGSSNNADLFDTSEQTIADVTSPMQIVSGDFNGDGKPDLAIGSQTGSTVTVLTNNVATDATTLSTSNFNVTTLTSGTDPWELAVGDINGDGKPDLAVANLGDTSNPNQPDSISLFLNTTTKNATTATFGSGTTISNIDKNPKSSGSPRSIAFEDLTGNGMPDLTVALRDAGEVAILLNETPKDSTTPVFVNQALLNPGPDTRAIGWSAANLTSNLDLVATSNTSNPPTGSYQDQVSVFLNTTPQVVFTNQTATGTIIEGNTPNGLQLVDSLGNVISSEQLSTIVDTAFTPGVSVRAVQITGSTVRVIQGVSLTFTAPKQSVTGTFSSSYTATVVTGANGIATAPTLTASDVANSSGQYWTLNVKVPALSNIKPVTVSLQNLPGTPTSLAFLTEPTNQDPNIAIAPAIEVGLEDAFGNVCYNAAASAVPTVNLLLSTNPTGAVLSGTLTQTIPSIGQANAGILFFNDISLDQPGKGYGLTASSVGTPSATSAVSSLFNIIGPAVGFEFILPSALQVNHAYTITVEAVDAFGDLAQPSTTSVTPTFSGFGENYKLTRLSTSASGNVWTYQLISSTVGRDELQVSATYHYANGTTTTAVSDMFFNTLFGSKFFPTL